MKEVIGSGDHDDRHLAIARPCEYVGQQDRFVLFAVDDQRLRIDRRHRPLARRRAHQHQVPDRRAVALQSDGRLRGHEASERESGQRDRPRRPGPWHRVRQPGDILDQVHQIVEFSAAVVMPTFGAADASKVGTHRQPAQGGKHPGQRRDDLVIEAAPVQRVRVSDMRDTDGRRGVGPIQRHLDPAGRSRHQAPLDSDGHGSRAARLRARAPGANR